MNEQAPPSPEKTWSPQALDARLAAEGLVPPRMLTLAITGVCNLSCSHCWVESGPGEALPSLPTVAILRLVGEFAALGGSGVRFTGGEPLGHPGWREVLGHACGLGLARVELQTNGTLLDDAAVAELAGLDCPGLALQISLDGACPATHDLVRGAGTFDAILSGLRRLTAAGLGARTFLAFTEMRHNLEEFPRLLELADALGLAAVVAGTLISGGRARVGPDPALAPAGTDQYLQLVARFERDPAFRERYHRLGTLAPLEWWLGYSADHSCCTFVEQPYLTPAGRLYPCFLCHADAFAVAGLADKPLAVALAEGAPLWRRLRQDCARRPQVIAACRECPERESCAAGCPGRALGSRGDLLAADDRCALRQALGRERRRLSRPG